MSAAVAAVAAIADVSVDPVTSVFNTDSVDVAMSTPVAKSRKRKMPQLAKKQKQEVSVEQSESESASESKADIESAVKSLMGLKSVSRVLIVTFDSVAGADSDSEPVSDSPDAAAFGEDIPVDEPVQKKKKPASEKMLRVLKAWRDSCKEVTGKTGVISKSDPLYPECRKLFLEKLEVFKSTESQQ